MIVEIVVATGKKEQSRSWIEVDGGAIVSRGAGVSAVPADVLFTMVPADAQAVHDRTLDLSVGFMRGQVKMAGDFGALLHFLPLTSGAKPALAPADVIG
jgi:hypothetical protein